MALRGFNVFNRFDSPRSLKPIEENKPAELFEPIELMKPFELIALLPKADIELIILWHE
jgi:hypothetical protein